MLRYSARDLGERGWDKRYGYGLADLPRAVAARVPVSDPIEPNDNIDWVNGRHFRRDAPVYRGRPRAFRARVDQLEDPADVYGVRLPARSTLRVRLRPLSGNPDLDAYTRRARTVWGRRDRLAKSYRSGRRTDTILLTNRSRRRRWAWIDVFATGPSLDADYRLSFQRVRYRPRAPRVP